MSKFLKVIVNLAVLISIVIGAALLIPPFVGINTVMNDNSNTETNLPIGSVAYGKDVKINDLKKKDKIIYTEGSSAYVYEIVDTDAAAGEYKVKDPYKKSSDTESITLQKAVPRVAVVIPLIGYAAIALQSKEGLIIIGLGIVFLIILFILSELWRKDDEEDDEDEDYEEDEEDEEEDEEEELSRKERRRLKKEEKRRRKEEKRRQKEEEYEEDEDEEEDEEEELSRKERRRLKKEEKRRRKLEKKGLLEEEEETDEEDSSELPQNQVSELPSEDKREELQGFDEAMKEAMSSIAMGVSLVSDDEEEKMKEEVPVQEPETVPEETVQEEPAETEFNTEVSVEETEPEVQDERPVNVNAVLRTPTVQELLDKAQQAGEKPEVKKDKENQVTLLDYSDIL